MNMQFHISILKIEIRKEEEKENKEYKDKDIRKK